MRRVSDELDLTAAGTHTIAVTNSYDAEKLSHTEKIVTCLSYVLICSLELNGQDIVFDGLA